MNLRSFNPATTSLHLNTLRPYGLNQTPLHAHVMLRWGLIPSWAKDTKIGNQCINAKAEAVAEKPAFRSAFKKHRCLVIATGLGDAGPRRSPRQTELPGIVSVHFLQHGYSLKRDIPVIRDSASHQFHVIPLHIWQLFRPYSCRLRTLLGHLQRC